MTVVAVGDCVMGCRDGKLCWFHDKPNPAQVVTDILERSKQFCCNVVRRQAMASAIALLMRPTCLPPAPCPVCDEGGGFHDQARHREARA